MCVDVYNRFLENGSFEAEYERAMLSTAKASIDLSMQRICLCAEKMLQRFLSEESKALPTHILGVSAYYHDSAACLIRDGHIVAAVNADPQKVMREPKPHNPLLPVESRDGTGPLRQTQIRAGDLR